MGRTLLFGAVMCAIMLAAATTRSDVAAPRSSAEPPAAPASEATQVGPSDSPAPKDPFTPFDTGPPEAAWRYDALTPEEKAVIDRGRAETGWQKTHDAYRAAILEGSQKTWAEVAEHDLGVVNLDAEGVVP